MIYDDYVNYCNVYRKKYGEKVVVLMEVGSFFEFYAVDKDGEMEGANMYEICSLLNIQSTRKNKSILECSRTNPLMAGFPTYILQKFIEILLSDQYTIVLVEQITPPPNPERGVTKIISPSTYIDHTQPTNSYLMCMYICSYQKDQYVLSITFMDITTGETFIFDEEIRGDRIKILQEMNRISLLYTPSELVMIGESFPYSSHYIDHTKHNITMYQNVSYQNAILTKVYPQTGLLSPIEYIDLEKRHDTLTNFVYLINFAYEHNEVLIKKLQKPKMIHISTHLRLMNSCVEHLSIIPRQGSPSSLLQLLNTCDTSIGKRYFKEALLNPLCNTNEIKKRYEWTEKLIPYFTMYRPFLKTIKDVSRLFRKILLGILQPSEMSFISTSLKAVQSIQKLVKEHIGEDLMDIQPLIHLYEDKWDMEKMSTHIHFYKKGVHNELDECQEKIDSLHTLFKDKVDEANKIAGDVFFKLELTNERQDYQITITSKRYETFMKKGKNMFTSQPLSSSNKTVLKVSFEGMYKKQQELNSLTSDLKTLVKEQYLKDLEDFYVFSEMMEKIVDFIGRIDFHVTCAKNAIQYHYVCPKIVGEDSMIHAVKVRHPLIEVFQKDIPFIPNDVHLYKSGMLLYGINSAGKSSYMKSVGINLIMAQAGMFVASETFEYYPYDHIFTRIPGGDNLFKGQSTFVAEISELRSILKYSTSRSLVIGDEVASGTESVSAISIVSSGIMSLCERNASFIFATHLHEVAQLESVKRIENLGIYHISVHYDEKDKILIYDRLLKEGSGETMYGLEVCKSLDMPAEFLHVANKIRQEYLQLSKTVVDMKQSRYSSQVFVDTCSICKNKAEEVHHIQEQMLADQHGFIGNIHKNDKHNLIAICEKCHDEIHRGSIKVEGFKQTSMGKMLITEDTKMIKDSINQIDLVSSMRKEGKSLKNISKELGMTLYQVNKILKS